MTVAKIVFASMTGNTEEIADIVADKFRDLGVEVDVDECTTVDAEDFLDADIAVVATYTYGDGELPDEIQDFYEDLAGLDLKGKLYGVVGSGDTMNSVKQLMISTVASLRRVLKKVLSVSKLICLQKTKILKN